MKRIVKVALLLMAVLTVIYAGVVAYAYANSGSHRYVVYGADKYESEVPPLNGIRLRNWE